eukprot:1151197-Pelagomonas_calceolata.AAC.1
MPTWQCDIIIRSVDLMKDSLHPDRPDEVAMPAQMPGVTTSECACFYNTNGKCVGMLTVDRLKTLLEASLLVFEPSSVHTGSARHFPPEFPLLATYF